MACLPFSSLMGPIVSHALAAGRAKVFRTCFSQRLLPTLTTTALTRNRT